MKYKTFFITLGCVLCVVLTAYAAKPRRTLKIQVTGVAEQIEKNVTQTLDNQKNQLRRPLTSMTIARFYRRAPKLIKSAMAPYGFFHPKITANLIKTDEGWLTTFNINKGVANHISNIKITLLGSGKNDKAFLKHIADKPFKQGDRLVTEKYTAFKERLFNIANRRGYINAKMVKSKITINLNTHLSTIEIVFNTGARFKFGKTTFSKTKFNPRFLHRFLSYHYDEPYSADKLENTRHDLVESNHFAQVLINTFPKKAKNHRIPIKIQLIPRKAKVYTFGLGYGTDTGFRGTIGVTLRHIGDWGQRFKTLLRGSEQNSSFMARYIMPGRNPAKEHYALTAGLSNLEQDGGSSGKNFSVGASYTRQFGRWNSTLALTYLDERYSITGLPFVSTKLLFPSVSLDYLNSDHRTNPTRGFRFSTQVSGTTDGFVSETGFLQVRTHIRALYTIKKTHTRLLFRNELGYTDIKDLTKLPLSLQLQAGGAESVRGYSFNVLGPGRNLAVGSIEVQQRVTGPWYLALFTDAAAIGDTDILSKIHVGVGAGVVLLTPVGGIQLSIANAITEPHKPWLIQFSMGPAL